jgi:Cd2+/Zn2+-exporting ATPase
MPKVSDQKDNFLLKFYSDVTLVVILGTSLILKYLKIIPISLPFFEILSLIAVIPVVISAIKGIIKHELTIDLLASIALIFSFLAGEWYSAAFINLMLAFARLFDRWTQKRTKNIIEHLLKYRPQKVKVKRGKIFKEIPVADVAVGDMVIIGAGERIPVDGTVTQGQASINEATLTGESTPRTVRINDKVYSPTLNESGSLVIKADKIADESTLAKIIDLVEEASLKKSKTIRIASIFTQWYILIILSGAVVIYFLTKNISLVLSILLVVCADDIAVSVPLTFTAAIARAAQRGILIKSAGVLEKLSKIKVFITDKTGTLTLGKPKIIEAKVLQKIPKKEFLTYFAAAEVNSTHPIKGAILDYAKREGAEIPSITEFNELPGEGITVNFKGRKIFSGKIDFLKKNGIKINASKEKLMKRLEESGVSISALGIGEKLLGIILFEDEVRPSARSLVAQTKALGVKRWIMLTGDNPAVAQKVARAVGIDQTQTNLNPKDKLNFIEKYKSQNKGVELAMIGDGVNDAAALALADVSFAMGAIGSDAAIDASDVALMRDNLNRISETMMLGRKTNEIVYENFAIWGATNAVGLFLVIVGILGPTGAATYNFLTDFLPIFNALRAGIKRV